MPEPRRLAIVTHVHHYRSGNRLYAYAPYAREIEIWAELFPEVVIAAPLSHTQPPRDCGPIDRGNVTVEDQPEIGGHGIERRVLQILRLPELLYRLHRVFRRADAVHVRCPGDLGFLGTLMAPLYTRYVVAKYAGQWEAFPREAWTSRFQKRLLASRWWSGPTTVYGRYPNQPAKVVSLFTSMMDEQQMAMAVRSAERGPRHGPLRVVFAGRLSRSKNANVVLEAVAALKRAGVSVHATIIGEGPEQQALVALRRELSVEEEVEITGGLPFEQVLAHFAASDALVLASETEGWPKVIAEAMAHGVICVASDRGFIREMLADGRGVLVPPGDSAAVGLALRRLADGPEEFDAMRRAAASWSSRYSREALREQLRTVLDQHWNSIPESTPGCVPPALRP